MFSIYLHIPYCRAICAYCDFNVYPSAHMPEDRYVAALIRELREAAGAPPWGGRSVQTIYFGGGTPSLFRPDSIDRILREIRGLWSCSPEVETTLEATPADVGESAFRAFRGAGVNRLSLGVQSFEPQHLRCLTRHHKAEDSYAAVSAARRAGFDNINVDLIFAVPGQTLAQWESDLGEACRLGVEHISVYGLTYEEHTPFHTWREKGRIIPASEDLEAAMFTGATELLTASGYAHYEISNYARPGRESRHNRNYWGGTDYLGVGAGAHSFGRKGWGERWANERKPESYMSAVEQRGEARAFQETLDLHQARGEYAFLALRQSRGLAREAFAERFQCDLDGCFPHVRDLCDRGLLAPTSDGYRLTTAGMLLSDSVFSSFF